MMKKIFAVLVILLSTTYLNAQTGKIRGKIIDNTTGEPLPFANVVITQNGQQKGGSTTDFDGKFMISGSPGVYTVVATYVSFATQNITGVEIKANEVTPLEIILQSQAIQGKTFVVTAKEIKNNEAAIQTMKRKSVNLVDGVSAKTFKRTGDNNAAAALKRVTGVSIQGGKDVYVRGLGDRYTKTILNGITIPGLDPDRNSVQVDIFPTNVIDNIIVYKTFSPDLPGDFTGGMVNIVTKDFPEQRVLGFSASLSYNPNMNLKSNFLSYQGASADNWAFGAADRALPNISDKFIPVAIPGNTQLERVTKSFSKEMAALEENSFLNQNFSFSIGNQIEKEKNTYGYTFAAGYRKNYKFYEEVIFGDYEKNRDRSHYGLDLTDADTGSIGTEEVLWNGLLSGSIKRKNSKYSLTLFHTQNGIKTASRLKQTSGDLSSTAGAVLDKTILYYNQRSISNVLLSTKHVLPDNKLEITTAVSPSLALNKEPDLRQTFFSIEDDTTYTLNIGDGALVNRIFRNLKEYNINGKVDVKKDFNQWNDLKAYVKIGADYTYKNRDFDVTEYNFRDAITGNYEGNPNELFTEDNLFDAATGLGIYAVGQTDSSSIYQADMSIIAGYIMNELPIDSSLKVIYGARLEKSQMQYTGQKQAASLPEDYLRDETVLDELDILPSISIVYAVSKDINIRANYARTLARPSFKEKSLAEIYDAVTQNVFIGNIDLEETNIDNMDLRIEKFMGSKDLVSISGFYKNFVNPIEIVAYSEDAPNNITPRNVPQATVYGAEFEIKKNLAFITEKLKSLSLGGNVTYAVSEVEMNDTEYNSRVEEARDGETIEKTREFQGQAPYLINTFISYSNYENGIDVNLSYNVQGPSLAIVGIARVPDVYDAPFHNLSFKASKQIGEKKRHKVSFSIQNILNSVKERYYTSYEVGEYTFSRFEEGTRFGLGYSFTFK